MKKVLLSLAALASVIGASASFAAAQAAIDVSDVVTGLGNQVTPMTSIFEAALGLAVVGAAFHWIRRALGR